MDVSFEKTPLGTHFVTLTEKPIRDMQIAGKRGVRKGEHRNAPDIRAKETEGN
jgi:hypothetical protein